MLPGVGKAWFGDRKEKMMHTKNLFEIRDTTFLGVTQQLSPRQSMLKTHHEEISSFYPKNTLGCNTDLLSSFVACAVSVGAVRTCWHRPRHRRRRCRGTGRRSKRRRRASWGQGLQDERHNMGSAIEEQAVQCVTGVKNDSKCEV